MLREGGEGNKKIDWKERERGGQPHQVKMHTKIQKQRNRNVTNQAHWVSSLETFEN